MATKIRGHKTEKIAVRMTPRQLSKLEHIALLKDATISDVVRDIVDCMAVDITLPYQNSNAGGLVLADPTGIAR